MAVPTISCLLPVYNGERYLASALDSVLAQSFGDFEIVVVDDGSSDGTAALLARYAAADARLIVHHKANGGIVSALNDGLALCRGRYVARMDADDLCTPDRFAVQAGHLDETPSCALVGGLVQRIDEAGQPLQIASAGRARRTNYAVFPLQVALAHHPLATMRRDVLTSIGGYRGTFKHAEDYDLFLRIERRGSIDNPDRVLLHYRVHGGSLSVKNVAEQEQNAALAELAAMLVHAGKADPADDPTLSTGEVHERLRATLPPGLLDAYLDLRIWRRVRSLDPVQGRIYHRRVIAAMLAPRGLTDRRFWALRQRMAAALGLAAITRLRRALKPAQTVVARPNG